jgi:membrane-associated phospholipid phosphatase
MVNRERLFFFKVSVAFYAVWILSYEIVGTYAARLPTIDLTSVLDKRIPLIALFVWPYELFYIFPLLPLFVIKDWHRFNRALLAVIIANLLAFIVYVTLPVAFQKPELGQGLSERLLAWEYAVDFKPGANYLPSLHVALAWIVFFACRGQRLSRIGESIILVIAVLITVSTFFVKQHLIADAVTGFLWAGGAWGMAKLLYPRFADPRQEARLAFKLMIKRIAPLALFLLVLILFAADLWWKLWIKW